MKKEKKRELIKVGIPALMMLAGTWNSSASVGNMPQPTSRDAEIYARIETRQEQPAETAFMQGEEDEGHAYLARANGCKAECMASCEGKCEWECSTTCTGSCDAACKDDCYYTCTGGCKEKCSGSCKGGCQGVCRDNCYGGCRGSEARNSENKQDMDWIDSIRRY